MNMAIKQKEKKKCEKCRAVLPANAMFCDVCGTPCSSPEQKQFRRKGYIAVFTVLLIALLIGAAIMNVAKMREKEMDEFTEKASLKDIKVTISAEEYEKISLGMKRKEVENIIGGPGKMLYGNYKWPGKYYSNESVLDSCAKFCFDGADRELTKKEEYGIVDEETIQEFRVLRLDEYEKIKSPTVKLNQILKIDIGMSLDQVESILGGEGMLIESQSAESITEGRHEIKRYGWKCVKRDKFSYIRISFEDGRVLSIPNDRHLQGVE